MTNDLTHWGIKGMKWGVRRFQNKDGTLTNAGRKRKRLNANKLKVSKKDTYHEDYKKAHDSKSVKNMSDAELRSRLNRLNMEKQYSQLSDTNVNKGKQYFDTTFKVATTVAAVTTTGLTIYNNADKIKKIVEPMIKKGT